MKLIVKSKSWCFNGLYFRAARPNSLEWTSFDLAAEVFDSPIDASIKMMSCGIDRFEILPAPEPDSRPSFTPSPESGFNPAKL